MSEEDKKLSTRFTRMDVKVEEKIDSMYYVCNECKEYCLDIRGHQLLQDPNSFAPSHTMVEVDYLYCPNCAFLEDVKDLSIPNMDSTEEVDEEKMKALVALKPTLPKIISAEYFSN